MSKTIQSTKKNVGQIKDHVASTLGASKEKPHKDDEARKNEAQYDVIQKEYDYGAGSILEQLKQKATEFFKIV